MKNKKIYILYARPYKSDDDEPPIVEVWSDGEKPKKRQMDPLCLYVYDDVDNKGVNERPWDGEE